MTTLSFGRRKRAESNELLARPPRAESQAVGAEARQGRATRLLGLGLAGTGVAHFAAPVLFQPITRWVFPIDTRQWIHRNGATETLVGVALAGRRTRRIGVLGLVAYVGFLSTRVVQTFGGSSESFTGSASGTREPQADAI